MKYMKVLEPIKLKDVHNNQIVDENQTELEMSFKQFILSRLADPQFSANMEMILSAYQIKNALEECNNEVLALETSDWEKLVKVVKNPSQQTPYHHLYAVHLVPFMKEVVDAKDKSET